MGVGAVMDAWTRQRQSCAVGSWAHRSSSGMSGISGRGPHVIQSPIGDRRDTRQEPRKPAVSHSHTLSVKWKWLCVPFPGIDDHETENSPERLGCGGVALTSSGAGSSAVPIARSRGWPSSSWPSSITSRKATRSARVAAPAGPTLGASSARMSAIGARASIRARSQSSYPAASAVALTSLTPSRTLRAGGAGTGLAHQRRRGLATHGGGGSPTSGGTGARGSRGACHRLAIPDAPSERQRGGSDQARGEPDAPPPNLPPSYLATSSSLGIFLGPLTAFFLFGDMMIWIFPS